MAETVVLSKILNVREKEKNEAQKAYHQAMDFFEKVANQLYLLLKKKEAAEESYETYIHTTTSLDRIREQLAYIERLNNQIMRLQQDVQKARSEMETKQLKLTDAHVEVKKFEKIIELRKQSEEEIFKKAEKMSMDEISIQQYLSHKNR
ncbi:flagellar export protein FliJ [Virgibacillus indicus]|uniref:Flagellar FliJ protein n=1 Tax=Virgibacillus indicus TaxID=2024554 RepID=A0A265NFS0_9BACI|nr:flagellar export protein FliJ [Virgibacillus indicus]OZU90319.1 flagellar export protein FliJ [Virgibacillus indicus]